MPVFKTEGKLRPVLFVVQTRSDISNQGGIHNKRIPPCTKLRIGIHL